MTDRQPAQNATTSTRPGARTTLLALAAGTLAAATLTGCATTTHGPPPHDPGADVASVDRIDVQRGRTASAQAFADRFAHDFARYLDDPRRTAHLVAAGVDPEALTRDQGPGHRRSRPSPRRRAGLYIAESVSARRHGTRWLLTALLVRGRGADRTVVPLTASAGPAGRSLRITSLNARAGGE